MKLVRFRTGRGRDGWGWLGAGGQTISEPVGSLASSSFEALLGTGLADFFELVEGVDTLTHELDSVRLLAPVARPGKIIGVGRNYREHAAEGGNPVPEAPMLFGILPSSVSGPYDDILLPAASDQVDWEGELGVVIGRPARRVRRADALNHIAGYVVLNDVSARDLQRRDGQWMRAKSFDTFKPLGPCLTTADELGLADSLRISVKVSGRQKQLDTTGSMVFPVAELIEYISAFCTLQPGDLIATGTPSGVGMGERPMSFLEPGDLVETEIEGIGRLANRAVPDPADAAVEPAEPAHA